MPQPKTSCVCACVHACVRACVHACIVCACVRACVRNMCDCAACLGPENVTSCRAGVVPGPRGAGWNASFQQTLSHNDDSSACPCLQRAASLFERPFLLSAIVHPRRFEGCYSVLSKKTSHAASRRRWRHRSSFGMNCCILVMAY